MSSNLYPGMKVVPENTTLDPERGRYRGEGLIVRTATYFQFVDKDTGNYVTPLYESSTREFWQGVRMKCLVASLIGRSRNIIQAGYWGVDFPDLDFRLMDVDGLTGMFLEKEQSWRRGQEDIIWVHTPRYAYALQAPVGPYKEVWDEVLANWQRGHAGRSGAFLELDRAKPPPSWWVGKQDWAILQAYEEPEDGDEDEDEDGNGDGQGEEEDEEAEEDKDEDDSRYSDSDSQNEGGGRKVGGNRRSASQPYMRLSARNSSSTRQSRSALDQVAPGGDSQRTASLANEKGKAKATMPEETHAEGSGSPSVTRGARRKQGTTGGRAAPRKSSNRPAKKARIASTPDEEVPPPVLPASRSSAAGPSRVQTAIAGPSSAGSSVLATRHSTTAVARQPTIEPTPRQDPDIRRASDEDSRPAKRPRIDPLSGSGKGKQKAVAPDQPAEWKARRGMASLQHGNMRGESAQVHGDSTSQGTPSQTPPNSTLEAPVYGPFPPPTSSPITPLTAWTTRPLTQVTPATPPGALEERDSGGNTEEPGEVDMSVSSSSGEGATEQDSVGPPEDVQVGTHMPAGLSQADVQGELSRVRDLLAQVGSREAHFAIPVAASTLSGPSANLATSERLAIDAVRGAAETLQRVTGVPVEPHLPTPGQVRPHSPPGPVDAGTSQASAVAGPSAQQERPQGVEDIGNRMSDLDLATRAPVRAGKQVQGRK
ncbi:hypothetical protein RSAG8_12581, partial [Rhizoctonia solani AG-8 WAC10335]